MNAQFLDSLSGHMILPLSYWQSGLSAMVTAIGDFTAELQEEDGQF